jgi:hypothetical protein
MVIATIIIKRKPALPLLFFEIAESLLSMLTVVFSSSSLGDGLADVLTHYSLSKYCSKLNPWHVGLRIP